MFWRRGCIPGSFNAQAGLWSRYTKDKRWAGILPISLETHHPIDLIIFMLGAIAYNRN